MPAPRRTVRPNFYKYHLLHSILTPYTAVDLVTETDRAVESLISTSLREKYPNYSFMGEETCKPPPIALLPTSLEQHLTY